MRKFVVAALGSMVVATPALAEDGDWTGPYIGVSAGYTSAHSDSSATLSGQWTAESAALRTTVTDAMAASQRVSNGAIGAHLGYNYQVNSVVVGLEVEAGSTVGGSKTRAVGPFVTGAVGSAGNAGVASPALAPNYTVTNSIDPRSLLAVKARGGVAFGNTLAFIEAGWAWVSARHGAGIISNAGYIKEVDFDKTHNGFLIGLGVEHRLGDHLSLRLTYDYTDQGDVTYRLGYSQTSKFTAPAYTETMTQDLNLHIVRVGASYAF